MVDSPVCAQSGAIVKLRQKKTTGQTNRLSRRARPRPSGPFSNRLLIWLHSVTSQSHCLHGKKSLHEFASVDDRFESLLRAWRRLRKRSLSPAGEAGLHAAQFMRFI